MIGEEGSDTGIASGVTSSAISALSVGGAIETGPSVTSCECEKILSEVNTAR